MCVNISNLKTIPIKELTAGSVKLMMVIWKSLSLAQKKRKNSFIPYAPWAIQTSIKWVDQLTWASSFVKTLIEKKLIKHRILIKCAIFVKWAHPEFWNVKTMISLGKQHMATVFWTWTKSWFTNQIYVKDMSLKNRCLSNGISKCFSRIPIMRKKVNSINLELVVKQITDLSQKVRA